MEPKVGAVALTLLSMIVVLIVLWALALLINMIKLLTSKKQEKKPQVIEASTNAVAECVKPSPVAGVSPKMVAVITAGLAAYLGRDTNQLMISAIYRLASSDNWAAAGRFENISSGSLIRRSV